MKPTRLIACAALFLTLGASSHAPRAADSSPSGSHNKPAALPAGYKATLRFLQLEVAAGAIADSAHQATFEVRATDAEGKPKVGVQVPLPVVASGGRAPRAGVSAHVAWAAGTRIGAGGLGVTDAKGVARGVFTSGNRLETTVLRLPVAQKPAPTASILQVWDEGTDGEEWDGQPLDNGQGEHIRFTMRFSRAKDAKGEAVWEPIRGHKLEVELRGFTISQWNPNAGADQDGDGAPDGQDQERVLSEAGTDEATWDSFKRLVTFDEVHEVEPGVYASAVRIAIPRDAEGKPAFTAYDWKYLVYDNNVVEIEGETDD